MALIDNVRRINAQEFPEDDQQTVEQLSVILNFFMEDVVNTINGNIDFANQNRELVTITLTIDANGNPIGDSRFSSNLNIIGTKVIRAFNLVNAAVFPNSAPFITYTNSGTGIYTIQNVTGLQANTNYRLLIEAIGG